MIASIGYLMSQAHVTFPGMLSTSEGKAFADLPSDALGAWAAVPEAGKMQIFAVATFNILIEAVCVSPFLVYLNNIVVPALAT